MNEHTDSGFTLPGAHAGDWEDIALDYVAGRLEGETLVAVQAHLAGCEDCRGALETQRGLLALLTTHSRLAVPPPDLADRVFTALDQQSVPEPSSQGIEHSGPASARTSDRRAGGLGFGQRLAGALRRTHGAVWLPAAAALILVAVALSQVDGFVTSQRDESASEITAAATMEAAPDSSGEQKGLAEEGPSAGGERSSDDATAGATDQSLQATPQQGESAAAQEAQVWRTDRDPGATWPPGLTAARLSATTSLQPLRVPMEPPAAREILVARVRPEEIQDVRDRLAENGFLITADSDMARGTEGTDGADGPGAALRLAREATKTAPVLHPSANGGFQLLDPGAAELPEEEDYLSLILIVPA